MLKYTENLSMIKTALTTSASFVPVLYVFGISVTVWASLFSAIWFMMLIGEKLYNWYTEYKKSKNV